MAEPVPLFVELCAGTAALSLRLARGGARPPVSRMGAKTGYADAILSRLGLHPGQGARAYLWCEPDPGCRLLLASYRDRQLAEAAAAVIRSWADEEPRALWEKLRDEGPARCPPVDPREVARWAYLGDMAYRKGEPESGYRDDIGAWDRGTRGKPLHGAERGATRLTTLPTLPATVTDDARTTDPREVARALLLRRWSFSERGPEAGYGGPGCEVRTTRATWTTEARDQSLGCERTAERLVDTTIDPREVARAARLMTANRLINLDPVTWQNTGAGGTTHGGAEFCTEIEPLAAGFEALPREVARVALVGAWSFRQGDPASGFRSEITTGTAETDTHKPSLPSDASAVAPRLDDLPAIPAAIVDDARHLEPADLPAGSWVYIDPPYQDTTGYAHDLDRAAVVELARSWRAAGAHVCISEAEPIAALVAEGWYTCEITHERRGQKRTFSKQQSEWLTMSQPPRGQIGLFG
jgi:16S rRNA G966 N2-methylase RsmD